MRSQLAWPRVLRDIGIVLAIATVLLIAIEVGILRGADVPGVNASSDPAHAEVQSNSN